jgi:hypothetical protein
MECISAMAERWFVRAGNKSTSTKTMPVSRKIIRLGDALPGRQKVPRLREITFGITADERKQIQVQKRRQKDTTTSPSAVSEACARRPSNRLRKQCGKTICCL